MADFDDYFAEDDFILDEAAEAALAETERQFVVQSQQSAERPAAKRQRTATGWAAGLGGRSESYGDFDSFPEIIVQDNGYQASARVESNPHPAPSRAPAYNPPAPTRHNPLQRQPQRNTPGQNAPQRAGTSNQRPQVSRRPLAVSHAPAQGPHPLEAQLQELRQQLDELRQSNSHLKSALHEAVNTKTRKEGEVTILRKTIEKHTQDHTAELLRLRAARQESEAKQAQIQKALKEDMERLKTQLLFKQQELEASLRKPPGSTRPKKGAREPPVTPLPSSSRGWSSLSQRPNFVIDVQQTPSRTTFKPPPKMVSPKKNSLLKSPSKPKVLPGFQNSFVTSTPLKRSKGKEKEPVLDDGNVFQTPLQSQPLARPLLPPPKPTHEEAPLPEPSFQPSPQRGELLVQSQLVAAVDEDGDVVMGPGSQLLHDELEEIDCMEGPNWKAELCRIILTHVRPGGTQVSFQQLLSVSFKGGDEVQDSRQYTSACIGIMNAISHPTGLETYDQTMTTSADSFRVMVQILAKCDLEPQLTTLFDMLSTLSFFLPGFRSAILGGEDPDNPSSSPLILSICALIVSYLRPTAKDDHNLGESILGFLETVALGLNDEDALRLTELLRSQQITDILLDPAQPLVVFQRTVRILVLLATRKTLCWALLSLPEPGCDDLGNPTNRSRVTDRLCAFLVDPTREGPECYPVKEIIFTYFAQLSLACPEAFAHLGNNPVLLASILWHTSHLTTPLYEEDERLMESIANSAKLVQYISQAVYFVYHLMVRDTPYGSLRQKLQRGVPKPLNNLQHVFIVAFGRLVYSPGPQWLEDTVRNQLLQLKDMSLWILNEVVGDGPELDGIASAYNDEPTLSQSALDEGEMEAEMVESES